MSPPRSRLPAPFHHPSTRLDGQAQANSWRACGSPQMEHLDRTPLVEFCNQNSPRAQPCDRPIPGAYVRGGASSLRWTWRRPPDGVGAPSATSTVDSGWHRDILVAADLSASSRRLCQIPAEVSRARGRPTLAARHLAPPLESRRRSFAPTRFRSNTSRHKTAAVPEGEPNTDRLSAEADRRMSCDLASQADPREQTRRCRPAWPLYSPLSRGRQLDRPSPSRLRSSRASNRAGRAGLLAQTNAAGAKGRLTRASAKKPEIRCTRGAFH
jgi:hypothetical protein